MALSKTIPPIDSLRDISTSQRDEFRDNGHLLVRGLLSAVEVAIYRQLVVDVVKRQSRERRKAPERGIYGRSFGQMVNLWRVDEGIRQFVLSRRLGKVAADLLGAWAAVPGTEGRVVATAAVAAFRRKLRREVEGA